VNQSNVIKRFLEVYIPTEKCNLTCSYCYISQEGGMSDKITPIGHTPAEIRRALSVKRLGGICLLNFCAGGETLLGEDLLPVIHELLKEGHYIQIVTNGTITKRFLEISTWSSELLDHIFFKFSFHYIELKERGCLDVFFDNVQLMRGKGCSISVEVMPHDALIPYIDEIKEICLQRVKALPHLTVGRDNSTEELALLSAFTKEEYENVWKSFDSEMFRYKMSVFGKDQRQFCYAGEWSCSLRIDTGDVHQCNGLMFLDNIYENIEGQIHFRAVGNRCPYSHCWNCHAYLCLGVIPEVDAPTYAAMRDRKCTDGSRWLTSSFGEFFNQKLKDNNIEYSANEKILINENSDLMRANRNQEQLIKQYKNEMITYRNQIENLQRHIGEGQEKNQDLKRYKQNLMNKMKKLGRILRSK